MTTKGRRRPAAAKDDAPPVDPRFVPVVKAFAKDRRVTTGGKGFGSSGLKVDGGRPFDPGHGRLMKEWVELDGAEASWIGLAREARAFVGAAKSK